MSLKDKFDKIIKIQSKFLMEEEDETKILESAISYFKNPKLSITDAVSNEYLFQLYKNNIPDINLFVSSHAKQFVNLCFLPDKSQLAVQSFLILSVVGNQKLITSILNDNFLNNMAQIVLQNDDPDFLIGRLGSITTNSFLTNQDFAMVNINFLSNLVSRIEDVSVFSLFKTIMANDPFFFHIHKWLNDIKIVHYFYLELKKIDISKNPAYNEAYSNTDVIKMANLYYLIGIGSRNPTLKEGFTSKEIIQALIETYVDPPPYLNGYRWLSLSLICNSETAQYTEMEELIPIALATLYEPSLATTPSHVYSLGFISEMIKYSKYAQKSIYESPIFSALTLSFLQFPNASIFQAALKKFIDASRHSSKLLCKVINSFVPLFITKSEDINVTMRAFCFQVILDISSYTKSDPKAKASLKEITEFKEFQNVLKNYFLLMEKSYGGPLPITLKAFTDPC